MKRRRDPYEEEPTMPYDPSGVPVLVEDDDTRPVDVDELEAAVRQSVELDEPTAAMAVRAVRTAAHARPRPFVDVLVAGAGAVVTLPVHRVSVTGVVLTVPPGVSIDLAVDTPVVAVIHLMRTGDEELLRARVPAHVAHHRAPGPLATGGLSLRWDLRESTARRAVETLVASVA
jgi:hypothetical protein